MIVGRLKVSMAGNDMPVLTGGVNNRGRNIFWCHLWWDGNLWDDVLDLGAISTETLRGMLSDSMRRTLGTKLSLISEVMIELFPTPSEISIGPC